LFSLSSFKLDYYLLPAMPAAALIIAPVIAEAEVLPRFLRRAVEILLVLSALAVVLIAALSVRAAALLGAITLLRFLPVTVALLGTGGLLVYLVRRKICYGALVLAVTICATLLAMQWVLLPPFARYLPAAQLAAAVPAGRTVYTSSLATDWANCIAFNLPAPRTVERLPGADGSDLLVVLQREPRSVAVIRESEYATLAAQDPLLKIIAKAETFGHGGLSLKMVRDLKRERLLLVGH
jgi:4-amino-4-deoxy-L-arabinose transferase-like glycosyltransferase